MQRGFNKVSAACFLSAIALWLIVTCVFIGLRPEHGWMAFVLVALFFASAPTRRLVAALMPFLIFGISYDWMNLLPNYKVNEVDIENLYVLEKTLFGINGAHGVALTPNEFFSVHHSGIADIFAGFFYLCWVPVPIAFGLWLYFSGRRTAYVHFALVFLLVNLLGFAVYYIHPAAPPWYVQMNGFEFVENTPGNVAGLGRFDQLTGLGVFEALYGRNSNVFAAMPSLHSAYMLVAFIYSVRARCSVWLRVAFAVICAGIWATAVYTSHHYVLDVLGGIGVTLLGFALFEYGLMRVEAVKNFVKKYVRYISA